MTKATRSLSVRLMIAIALSVGAPLLFWVAMMWAESARHTRNDDWFDIYVFGIAFPLTVLAVLLGASFLLSCLLSSGVAACAAQKRLLRILQMTPFALAGVAACLAAFLGELLFYRIFGFFFWGTISFFLAGVPATLLFIRAIGKQQETGSEHGTTGCVSKSE